MSPPMRSSVLPLPIMPPRGHRVVRTADSVSLDLLNFRVPWNPAIEWTPPDSRDWTHLRRHHLHYMEYLEVFNDVEFMDAVDSWIAGNPPYEGRYWHDSWSSYAISLRVVVWMQQLASREDLPEEFLNRAQDSLVQQIRVLRDHLELDIRGNHLVKNAKALIWAAAFFDGTEPFGWRQCGEKLLEEIIDEQILADGMHYELSASYHAQVFSDFLECVEVLPESDLRARMRGLFPKMAHALMCVTHPDGAPALFNDAGFSMAYSASQILDAARSHIGEVATPQGGFSLPDAGFYGFRSEGDYFLVKGGRIGPDALPAHAHADLLSFEWDVQGDRVIVDPGVAEYEPGPLRDYARSTGAHNTVTIAGIDQAEMWASFRVGRRGRAQVHKWVASDEHFFWEATHDGYSRLPGSPLVRRRIRFVPGELLVEDTVLSTEPTRGRSSFLIASGWKRGAGPHQHAIENNSLRIEIGNCSFKSPDNWMVDFGVLRGAQRWELSPDVGQSAVESRFLVSSLSGDVSKAGGTSSGGVE